MMMVTRANFLLLTFVIVFAGLAAAFWAHATFNFLDAVVVLAGALLTHASVNAFNNYFDYRSGIDARTSKTPFSGGIDVIVKGEMKPLVALGVAVLSLVGAGLIGLYFLLRMFVLLFPVVLYGGLVIVLYTPVLSRIHAISEFVAGSGFGLMGLGVYATQAGTIDATSIALFVPISILVALLLFLNEFPDADADRAAGRRHLVILLGGKRASSVYVTAVAATHVSILLSTVVGAAPLPILISFLTIPIGYKAARIALANYHDIPNLVPALGLNVIWILMTILLMAAGFVLASFL